MIKNQISKVKQESFIRDFINFFEEETGESIGIIKAEIFLDFFIENLGKNLYNSGIESSKNLFLEKAEEITFNLDDIKE